MHHRSEQFNAILSVREGHSRIRKGMETLTQLNKGAVMFKKHSKAAVRNLLAGLIVAGSIMPQEILADSAAMPKILGKSIGEWSAKWWQWALAAPASSNPTQDDSGAFCDLGQQGAVWFLAGVFGGGTTERSCNIPEGKYILFPLANAFWINSAWDEPSNTEADYRKMANDFLDPSIGGELEATLDGTSIIFNPNTPIIRTQSPVFTANFPIDNLFGLDPSGLTGYPIVSDGFWVMLPSLEPGEHVLHFRAGHAQDITYHLSVTKE